MSALSPRDLLPEFSGLTLANANEAETRLKLIDRVLFEILGWSKRDVSVEHRVSEDGQSSYVDYRIKTAMTQLVIEAKRVGATFSLNSTQRQAHLRGNLVAGDVGAAIEQARDYARKLSIPFACVTNGSQWIVFPATRTDGITFSESKAVLFHSLEDVVGEGFLEFSDLLSRASVISGALELTLLGRRENQIGDRRLNRSFRTHWSKTRRRTLFPLIEDAVYTAFSEDLVQQNPELLEKCYVTSQERTRFDAKIRMHVVKRESSAPQGAKKPMKDKDREALVDLLRRASKTVKPIAVLVLGMVGAGKTTFIRYTRTVSASKLFEPSMDRPYSQWIYVDFRDLPPMANFREFLLSKLWDYVSGNEFLSDFDRCLRPAFRLEIEALKRGPLAPLKNNKEAQDLEVAKYLLEQFKNRDEYLRKVLSYAAKNAPIFLVIDNVDQFENESLQSEIFSETVAMGHAWGLNLVLALRDSTFAKQRHLPIFDAFDFEPYYINPPAVFSVISKRFLLTRSLLQGTKGEFVAENGATVKVDDLAVIVDLIQRSVLGTEVGNLIDVLATSDIRLALRMTREFLEYGYSATGRALAVYQSTGKYVLPEHEALRAIMLGNHSVYDEQFSVIGNPFDARISRTEAQLLRLYVLSAIVSLSSDRTFQHLDGEEIVKKLRELGFSDDITERILKDLCKFRFLHTLTQTEPRLDSQFVPSRLGGYIIRDLIGNFMFIENVMMDTFISDEAVWQEIKGLTTDIYNERHPTTRLRLRKARATKFYQHLKRSYAALHEQSVNRGFPIEWCSHPLKAMESDFNANLTRAARASKAHYGAASKQR